MTTTTEETGLAVALVRLSHLVQHVFADVSRAHALTPQQTQLLCTLIDRPVGMTELSRLLHLEKSSLTGLVDRVERRGLVARTRDSRDRRACRIELTSQGARLAAASHQDVTARLEMLTGELRPADASRLAAAIARIVAEHDTSSRAPGSSPIAGRGERAGQFLGTDAATLMEHDSFTMLRGKSQADG